MVAFIDNHREEYGVEPICGVLPIAPSTYYRAKDLQAHPEKRCSRAQRDDVLKYEILDYWEANRRLFGVRKIWHGLRREKNDLARCTVTRLMRDLGIRGIVRGRRYKSTTEAAVVESRPSDLVERDFTAGEPNQLWVADLTYVATWSGFVYVAFVIDVFANRIVGWRASRSLRSDLALDALDQALYARNVEGGLIHHSDRGVQYASIRYTNRLAEAGIEPSVGSVGDSYDNALAETIIGLYKTELIEHEGPWRNLEHVELETLSWVSWFNGTRPLERLGYLSPAEYEEQYYQQKAQTMGVGVREESLR
jgi:putative transposase